MSSYAIARLYGLSQTTVRHYLSKYGLRTIQSERNPAPDRRCLCGERIKGKARKFCSPGCSSRQRSEDGISLWLKGEVSGTDSYGELRDSLRRFLVKEAENKCTLCGWSVPNPFSGKVTLNVDHVDGDSTNNTRSNLVVLCCNCHTLTPTYNNLNRGNGKRYSPGLRQSGSIV